MHIQHSGRELQLAGLTATIDGITTLTFAGAAVIGAASGFAGGVAGTLLYGGSLSQALKSGLRGALQGSFSAGGYFGAGELGAFLGDIDAGLGEFSRVLAHGAIGGISETMRGGKFEHGFISAVFSASSDRFSQSMISSAIVGGTAAALSGGKFANGAITGAFSYVFNRLQHVIKSKENPYCPSEQQCTWTTRRWHIGVTVIDVGTSYVNPAGARFAFSAAGIGEWGFREWINSEISSALKSLADDLNPTLISFDLQRNVTLTNIHRVDAGPGYSGAWSGDASYSFILSAHFANGTSQYWVLSDPFRKLGF